MNRTLEMLCVFALAGGTNALSLTAATSAPAVSATSEKIVNPIGGTQYAADPMVVWDDVTRFYYHLHTEWDFLKIYRSKKIADIFKSESKIVFRKNEKDGVLKDIWAPEFHKAPNGKWYIYTSGQTKEAPKCLLVMESETDDPFGEYAFKGYIDYGAFSIDPTVMTTDDRKQYMCYSKVYPGAGQTIVVREMLNPWTLGSRQAEIAHAEFPWELKHDVPLNEGGFFLRSPDRRRLFIIYSGNGCFDEDYGLGVIEHMGGDLCDAKNWKKHPEPILVKGNGVLAPGHASFFRSPDGSEVWCAYHGLPTPMPRQDYRRLHLQRVSFDATGYPVLGRAIGCKPQDPPSGEGR